MKKKIDLNDSSITVRTDDFGMLISNQPNFVVDEDFEIEITHNDTLTLIRFLNDWAVAQIEELNKRG